jgi:hypothetical protein
MANARGASKDLRHRNLHVPNDPTADLQRGLRQHRGTAPQSLTFRPATGEYRAPDSRAANPIPVCSLVNNYDAR